jgi:hypothetical protein
MVFMARIIPYSVEGQAGNRTKAEDEPMNGG